MSKASARSGLVAMVVLAMAGVPAAGQSLADVAKKEAERRGAVRSAGRVYNNDTLTPDYTTPPPPTPPPAQTASPARATEEPATRTREVAAVEAEAGSPPAQADEADGVTPRDEQEPQRANDKGEDYWRGRASLIRGRLAAQNRQIEALRQRMSSFTPGAAVPERDVAERALAKALEDQRFLQDEWERFERTARERGVPDAWIR